MLAALGFIALGLAIGTFGTLIGAGGGFILLPVLALLSPQEATSTLTATTLAVVAANATSGAIAYGRQRRIDFRSGIPFALATLPGSIVGAILTRTIPRAQFDVIFAALLIALAILVTRARPARAEPAPEETGSAGVPRVLVDVEGTVHRYHVDLPLGIAISFVVGFASSLLGIGGGVIHVPALIGVLGFPVHVATATSHFVLAIMAAVGTVTHLASGDLDGVLARTIYLSFGAIVGAQAGARVSRRVQGAIIIRVLATALVVVALRLGAQGLFGV